VRRIVGLAAVVAPVLVVLLAAAARPDRPAAAPEAAPEAAGVAREVAADQVKPPPPPTTAPTEAVNAEVVVYGATPSGVMAAVAAARQGHTVALIEQTNHVGGVVAGGLVDTDIGDRSTVGGLAAEFFKRTNEYYLKNYGPKSKQLERNRGGLKYEPHIAEQTFDAMLADAGRVSIFKRHRVTAATVMHGRITSIATERVDAAGKVIGGRTFTGAVFVDASYTGDVMARAGVPYRLGRESRAEYGETLAGISAGPAEVLGTGDHRTQAFNYRVSVTSNAAKRIPFPKPEHYDPEPWRGDARRIRERGITTFANMYAAGERKAGPNDKYDSNWFDLIGGSEGYAEADYDTRARIEQRHKDYALSRLYFLANDSEVPAAFRAEVAANWGLPTDEFVDSGHFPFQIYVRAARRMVGRYVLRERDLTQERFKPDGVCAGSYGIDCHPVQRVVVNGEWEIDRTRHMSVDNYDIPYACMTPYEPSNLLVPVCQSASHVAYCSLRMEPVFMMLGQAAGNAAHLAVAKKTSVQDVNVPALRALLRDQGMILDAGYMPPVKIEFTPAHPKAGQQVTFKAVRGELKSPLAKLSWDFEGTGHLGAEGETATYSFSLEKPYTVSLVVQDEVGRRRMVSVTVPVGAAMSERADVTVDEFDGELTGQWEAAYPELPLRTRDNAAVITPDIFVGPCVHFSGPRGGGRDGPVRATFRPMLPQSGRYEVCIAFRPSAKLATNVPVTIRHARGEERLTLDQRHAATPFVFTSVGEFHFEAGRAATSVELTNANADGRVAADAVRFVWRGE
jgi:hypothetical protein